MFSDAGRMRGGRRFIDPLGSDTELPNNIFNRSNSSCEDVNNIIISICAILTPRLNAWDMYYCMFGSKTWFISSYVLRLTCNEDHLHFVVQCCWKMDKYISLIQFCLDLTDCFTNWKNCHHSLIAASFSQPSFSHWMKTYLCRTIYKCIPQPSNQA